MLAPNPLKTQQISLSLVSERRQPGLSQTQFGASCVGQPETLLRRVFRVLRLKGPIPVQPVDDHQRFRLFVLIDEAKILSTGGGDRTGQVERSSAYVI